MDKLELVKEAQANLGADLKKIQTKAEAAGRTQFNREEELEVEASIRKYKTTLKMEKTNREGKE